VQSGAVVCWADTQTEKESSRNPVGVISSGEAGRGAGVKSRGCTLSGGRANGEGVLAQSKGVISSEDGGAGSHRAIEGLYFVAWKRQRSRSPRAIRVCKFIGRGLEGIQRAIRCCLWGRKRQRRRSPRAIRGCDIMAVGGAGSHRAIRGCKSGRGALAQSGAVICLRWKRRWRRCPRAIRCFLFFLPKQRGWESACTPVLYLVGAESQFATASTRHSGL
jgi:hypothetical protein